MKAISLWQPWASAIALGHKRIETRSFPCNHRGPIAIHAAKRWGKDQREFAAEEGIECPLGAIVAVAVLVACRRTEDLNPTTLESRWGDFYSGRYGWILQNIRALDEPIPFVGRQGFFDVPDELLKDAKT